LEDNHSIIMTAIDHADHGFVLSVETFKLLNGGNFVPELKHVDYFRVPAWECVAVHASLEHFQIRLSMIQSAARFCIVTYRNSMGLDSEGSSRKRWSCSRYKIIATVVGPIRSKVKKFSQLVSPIWLLVQTSTQTGKPPSPRRHLVAASCLASAIEDVRCQLPGPPGPCAAQLSKGNLDLLRDLNSFLQC
jgi:hypothetical protein